MPPFPQSHESSSKDTSKQQNEKLLSMSWNALEMPPLLYYAIPVELASGLHCIPYTSFDLHRPKKESVREASYIMERIFVYVTCESERTEYRADDW